MALSRAALPLQTDTGPTLDTSAPAFALCELDTIAAWSASMRPLGVSTELNLGHVFLTEALHIVATGTDEPLWMVHKTPTNAVAVRVWPGSAAIVPTVEDALAIVADDLAQPTPRRTPS
jgi:hypothetical protein